MEPDLRFVCRREGHEPMVKVTKVTGLPRRYSPGFEYVTKCKRCGQFISAVFDRSDSEERPDE